MGEDCLRDNLPRLYWSNETSINVSIFHLKFAKEDNLASERKSVANTNALSNLCIEK